MKVFIGNYTGICNHLESVILAFAIRERFGHQVWLDWPELDAFSIESTQVGPRRFFHRFNGINYRGNNESEFETLGRYRHIDIRGMYGAPPALLDAQLERVVTRIRLHSSLAQQIRDFFATIKKPVVGVHIRRGDFKVDPQRKLRHAATSDTDLIFTLEQLSQRFPDTVFLLSYTGRAEDYRFLFDRFDCVTLPIATPYRHHGPTQASEKHPIADLFALACCTSIVVTPRSSFSHWAANCLGAASTCIVPAISAGARAPALLAKRFGRCRLPIFMEEPWQTDPTHTRPLPAPTAPITDWL
ncbi:MAG: alpha-1,2-fucosyltransferase [Pseudomonadota bacterium]